MDGDSRSLLIIFIVLVFFSAYFACSESAFSLMNKIRVKNMADEGNKKAKRALYISNNFEKALTTILIGNNIVNIAAASVATLFVLNLLRDSSYDEGTKSTIATVSTTAIIFLFGEMIPKSFANDRPLSSALRLAGITKFFIKIFTPLSAFFGMISSSITRLFKGTEEPTITEEELYDIIDTAEEEGVVDEEQSELFKSAIEFSETTAENVMTMRDDIVGLDISMTNDEIMLAIRQTTHSRLPVFDGSVDDIIGTLPIRSFIKEYYKDPALNLRTLLIPPFFVKANAKIDDLLSVMRQHKFYLAVVSGEEGETLGIVTIEDFLEELVGEIWDEHDEVIEEFTQIEETVYRVSCDVTISDFCDYFDVKIESESTTLNGFMTEQLQKIAEEGDEIEYLNLKISVIETESHRATFVKVEVFPEELGKAEESEASAEEE